MEKISPYIQAKTQELEDLDFSTKMNYYILS